VCEAAELGVALEGIEFLIVDVHEEIFAFVPFDLV